MVSETLIEIDIPALTLGMRRINEEKAEINLVLAWLRPWLARIADTAANPLRANFVYTLAEQVKEVFSIKDNEGNTFRFEARLTDRWSSAQFRVYFYNHNREVGFCLMTKAGIHAESLAKEEVGPCWTLLKPFIAKVLGCFDSYATLVNANAELEVFYTAAKRAKK